MATHSNILAQRIPWTEEHGCLHGHTVHVVAKETDMIQQLNTNNMYLYILYHILFHYGLLQDIEKSSLCYTVGPCYLSIVCVCVCVCVCVYSDLHLLIPETEGKRRKAAEDEMVRQHH